MMIRARGFTLVELAVVMAIIGVLLASMMMTLSARVEQQNRNDTQRRLDEAKDLLLSFALVNGRLPCPATAAAGSGNEAPVGGGACSTYQAGFLPARAIGFQPTDGNGYALDAWGNRIRYSVSRSAGNPASGAGCVGPASPGFTSSVNLKANGVACAPQDIVVCDRASGTVESTPSCGTAAEVTNRKVVVAIIFSTGKNGSLPAANTNEAANTDGGTSDKGVYVHRTPEEGFDDMLVWIPVGSLYGRLISAGILP